MELWEARSGIIRAGRAARASWGLELRGSVRVMQRLAIAIRLVQVSDDDSESDSEAEGGVSKMEGKFIPFGQDYEAPVT